MEGDAVYISSEIDEEMRASRVQHLDVLLNITGASIGRCTVFDINQRANVNQHVCILRAKPDVVLPIFLASFFQSDIGQKMISTYSTKGGALPVSDDFSFRPRPRLAVYWPEKRLSRGLLATWPGLSHQK
jgi:hypothetical protein